MGSTADLLPSVGIDPKTSLDQRRPLPPRNRDHDHMASAFASNVELLMREIPKLLPSLGRTDLSCGTQVDVVADIGVD